MAPVPVSRDLGMLCRMGAVIRYCEGRPERAPRTLGPDERTRVIRFHRWLRARVAWRALAVPLVCGLAWAAALGAPLVAHARHAGALGGLATLGVLLPVALLWIAAGLRGVRALGRDVEGGVVLEFGDGEAALAILPESERVLAIGGEPADLRERAPVGEAAPPAPAGATYALEAAALERAAYANGLVRRPLTAAERAELAKHVARLARPTWTSVLLAVGAVAVAARIASSPGAPAALRALAVVVLGAGAFYSLRRLWSLLRLARTLEDDAEDGWVVRLTAGEMAGDELLLRSGVPWTVEGGPADWRMARPARST